MFGYHVTGSTGTLFLYGIVVGALALAGLSLLLGGARRTSRRGREARRGLAQSRRETAAVSADRDDLIVASASPPAPTRPATSNGTSPPARRAATAPPWNGSDPGPRGPSLSQRLFGATACSPAARGASHPGLWPRSRRRA